MRGSPSLDLIARQIIMAVQFPTGVCVGCGVRVCVAYVCVCVCVAYVCVGCVCGVCVGNWCDGTTG